MSSNMRVRRWQFIDGRAHDARNLTIEGGARAGLIAVDDTTINYIKGRPRAPKGAAFEQAEMYWKTLQSDADAKFDAEVTLDARASCRWLRGEPRRNRRCQSPPLCRTPRRWKSITVRPPKRALDYMGISAGMKLTDIKVDHVSSVRAPMGGLKICAPLQPSRAGARSRLVSTLSLFLARAW